MSGKCPLCGKRSGQSASPFCSARCATLDLGQWLSEGYRVPTDENAEQSTSLPDQDGEEEM